MNGADDGREVALQYFEFLDDSMSSRIYTDKVLMMLKEGGHRLIVDLQHIWQRMPERANRLVCNFVDEIVSFESALREFVQHIDGRNADTNVCIGFEGSLGHRHVNPRTLKSMYLTNLVCVEGIVTKCSTVQPKVVHSVHYCPATGKTIERLYADSSSYVPIKKSTGQYPKEDENKNRLETEFGLSKYKDHQTFSMQEMPESAPVGQIPRVADVVLDGDLTDRVKPGDRVRVFGLYRCIPGKQGGYTHGSFSTIVLGNNVQLMSKEVPAYDLDANDVRRIKEFGRQHQRDSFKILSRSLAPSILGHDEVKHAILCMLLGGVERKLDNGTRIRGDINLLLIGDPSVAKSQLLRYVIQCAPRVISTSGRGSSGVGLTAAVSTDSVTGQRRLEAGAMVLADRGIVCIDEFDKMKVPDRTAIHEDSLLSRFDCVFVMLDTHDKTRDTEIANHIVNLHRFRVEGESEGQVLRMGGGEVGMIDAARGDHVEELGLAEQDDVRVRGASGSDTGVEKIWVTNQQWMASKPQLKCVSADFLRKFIMLAKSLRPTLSSEAAAYISARYAQLRQIGEDFDDRERTTPVTARMLESMIRIATAMAKTRLSNTVDQHDADSAYQLVHFACMKCAAPERIDAEIERLRQRTVSLSSSDDEVVVLGVFASKTARTKRPATADLPSQSVANNDVQNHSSQPLSKREKSAAAISVTRYTIFKQRFRLKYDLMVCDEGVQRGLLERAIQGEMGSQTFSKSELHAAWKSLENDNAMMIDDDDNVILI